MQKLSKEKIFYIWLLLQPIIDLIVSLTIRNSDSSITIGIILRGLFLLTLLLVTIFSKKIKNKKNIYAYLIMLFIYFILYMLIRINDNKYLLIGDNVRATLVTEEIIDFGNITLLNTVLSLNAASSIVLI